MIKFLGCLAIWVVALIPTYLFLLLKFVLAPVGFWQIVVTYGIGLFIFGGIQSVLLVIAIMLSFAIITGDF
jgi:hypothetical protein